MFDLPEIPSLRILPEVIAPELRLYYDNILSEKITEEGKKNICVISNIMRDMGLYDDYDEYEEIEF